MAHDVLHQKILSRLQAADIHCNRLPAITALTHPSFALSNSFAFEAKNFPLAIDLVKSIAANLYCQLALILK